jgi:TolB protein
MNHKAPFIFLLPIFLCVGATMHAGDIKETSELMSTDVGNCEIPGWINFDPNSGVYRIGGSGKNMWFKQDDFHFVCKKMSGDFILTAQFRFMGDGVDPHRKVGWMVRQTLDSNSPYADAVVHGDGFTSLQYRTECDADTKEIPGKITAPNILQLEKIGNTFFMRAAKFGEPLQTTGVIDVVLGDSAFVGLAMCSHNAQVFEEAEISNVRIVAPAPNNYKSYQDYCGSRLEIVDVETGARKIIYETDQPIEAPNWTRDGKALIYNSRGLLYRFDLETKTSRRIETDFAVHNNNDHVISFEGKKLAISNHVEGETGGGSAIFIMPIDGGTPKRITALTPSYLHGWSADDTFLVYTAQRNNQYDIYQISVNGGEEVQLTNQPTLDDGSEYSSDGEWIYFNSARTGVMQIWRMKPDGGNKEQLTFDDWNNWFPHISPDGKKVIFLSYPKEVDAQDHPHYKHVMLRILPRDGGDARVIAYLYGGQGTINVPSWSPDSKKAAFVSYSF